MSRLVSFLASGTEIAVALGLQEALVGISHECDWPPQVLDRPRVSRPRFDPAGKTSGEIDQALRHAMAEHGSAYSIDEARLAELQPDLILTQAVCEVCAVPTAGVLGVVRRVGLHAQVVSLDAHTLEDILRSIEDVAAAAGVQERGADLVTQLKDRMGTVQAAVRPAQRSPVEAAAAAADPPRVLALEWLDPPFSPGHWVPEMITMAGGTNLLGTAGAHSGQVAWSDMEELDPDVLVIMPCGYDLAATRVDADAAAERLFRVAPRAIADGRAFIVDGSAYFNRSGPRVVTGIEILATLLHPQRFQVPLHDVAERWPSGPRPSEPFRSDHC